MAKKRIDRSIDLANSTVTFTVMDTSESLSARVADFPADIVNRLILHGINAKVGDSAADPTVNAFDALKSTVEQLIAGTWNVRGSGGGPRVTVLAEALSQVTGQPLDAVVDKLDAMSPEERKALPKKYAKVDAAMKKIAADRATAKAKAAKGVADKSTDEGDLDSLFA